MQITAGRWEAVMGAGTCAAALALRARVYRGGAPDRDLFDDAAQHLVIRGPEGVAACARLTVQDRAAMGRGYTAQFYDIAPFATAFGRALELGRVTFAPGATDPEVARLLLAVTAQVVTQSGAEVLYGCSSFPAGGVVPLAQLSTAIAPDAWRPAPRAPETIPLRGAGGRMQLPPLLRSYLSLGAKVSDHAVVDRDLGTVHVFTGLPIAAIPPARARLLTGMLAPA